MVATALATMVAAALSAFEPMLFMDLADTAETWGLVWPQAGTVVHADPSTM